MDSSCHPSIAYGFNIQHYEACFHSLLSPADGGPGAVQVGPRQDYSGTSQAALVVRTCLPMQDSVPGSGRSPGEGNGNPLQYSCLEKSHGQRSLAGYSPQSTGLQRVGHNWSCFSLGTTQTGHLCSGTSLWSGQDFLSLPLAWGSF